MKKFDAMIRSDLSPRDQTEDGGSDEGYEEQRAFQPRVRRLVVILLCCSRPLTTLETITKGALAIDWHIVELAR